MARSLVRLDFRESVRTSRAERGLLLSPGDAASVQAHLLALLRPTVLSKRVSVKGLVGILEAGRFKTVHEDGIESHNPGRTMDEEAAVWNLGPARPEEFPIFGYAASLSDMSEPATRYSLQSAYGSVRVILSSELREQTSVFFGDSLSWIRRCDGAPAPLDSPDELTWPFDRGSPFDRESADDGGADEYVELQFIGGISLAMMESVIFDYHLLSDTLGGDGGGGQRHAGW